MKNLYTIKDSYAELTIFSKKHGTKIILVDIEDINKLKKISWCYHKSGYIQGRDMDNFGKKIYIHRFITDCPISLVIDHINRDPFDNRKQNLKICTQIENMNNLPLYKSNKTGYKNVSYQKESDCFVVTIRKNGKNTTLCRRKRLKDAVKERNLYYKSIGKDQNFINRLDIRKG